MRRLNLHASALNDAEYDLYTSSLDDLAESNTNNVSHDDVYYESLKVGIREARAWFRGRYSHVPLSDIDSILKLFHSNFGQPDSLTGGQFFAALRLVIHAEGGEGVDRSLAFVQAHPHSRPLTPSRHSHHPPLSPPPVPRQSQHTSRAPSADRNPFSRRLSDTQASPQDGTSSHPITVVPQSNTQFHSQKITHNPFLMRDKTTDGPLKPNANADIRSPPLPPRKPAPAPPLVPPPRHASLILNTPSKSTPPVIPSSSSSIRTTHITSPLMRQSLQASKVAQTMKKAEEQLEKERVLQVLKTASSSRTRSTSPSKTHPNGFVGVSASASGSGSDEAGRVPPLPARRTSKSNPSSSSSAGSQKSLEQVASASVMHSRSPFRHVLPDRELTGSPFSESPNRSSADLSTSVPLLAPPTHPDRKPTEPPTPTTPESPASQTPRVFRSKSLHHPSPPPPPLPRRRPGSVQLTPHATPELSPFFPAPHQQLPESRSEASTLPGLSRHLSLSSHTRNSSRGRDQSNAINTPESPIANLQRTLTSLQLKAQPKLDAARYKAEAGLSRRGYVHHSHHSPWVEEGEEGLMVADAESEDGRPGVDPDYDGSITDDEHSSEEARMRGRRIAAGWDKGHADSLKWPAGEGWKQL